MPLPEHGRADSQFGVIVAITLTIAVYFGAALAGWPQRSIEMVNSAEHVANAEKFGSDEGHGEHAEREPSLPAAAPVSGKPPFWMVIPFCALLGAIAVFPLLRTTEHWWEHNCNKFFVSAILGLLTLLYYSLCHSQPIARHFLGHAVIERGDGVLSWQLPATVIANAILQDFIPFIVLLFSLWAI